MSRGLHVTAACQNCMAMSCVIGCMPLSGRDVFRGLHARPGRVARQGCLTRLVDRVAQQGCLQRLFVKAVLQNLACGSEGSLVKLAHRRGPQEGSLQGSHQGSQEGSQGVYRRAHRRARRKAHGRTSEGQPETTLQYCSFIRPCCGDWPPHF